MPDPRTAHPSLAIPVLDVIVLPPGVTGGVGTRCLALVDTGADDALVHRHLIDEHGLTLRERAMNRTSTGVGETTIHELTVMLTATDGNQFAIHSSAAATDFGGHPYKLILGRSLLRHGELVLDYSQGRFELAIEL